MEKKLTTADNLDLFYYPNPATHSFCLCLYVRAGCIYESDRDNGITHFLEHLLFRSINRQMDGQMYKTLDRLGLYFNGATYKELMQLYIVGAPEHFEEAGEILLRAFRPLAVSGQELATEQQRVKAEIREAEEYKSLDYFAGTFAWQGTPVKNTILGTKGNISRFSRKRMEEYRGEILQSGSAFFYVTGNVSKAQMEFLRDAAQAMGAGRRESPASQESPAAREKSRGSGKSGSLETAGGVLRDNRVPLPPDFGRRPLTVHVKNSSYCMVQFSFDIVTEDAGGAELNLLYDMLFSGENSLIHQELSEKRGWIYSCSSVLEKYSNAGRMYFTYEIDSRRLAESVALVAESLASLNDEKAVEERLQYVLPEYLDNAWMTYDDNESFNWQRAYEGHIMGRQTADIEETRRAYAKVTPAGMRDLASRMFRLENLVLSVKGKKARVDTQALTEALRNSGLNRNRPAATRETCRKEQAVCQDGKRDRAIEKIKTEKKGRCVNMTFKQLFFRYYDRKVSSGEMSFSQTGIRKDDFTRLCTEEDFVFAREDLALICSRMGLTEAETAELFEAVGRLWDR